ncbi:hypothetical protein BpHYR1_016291 [Brachionus plicatilis]|uniref:Uncharacterized protein n=1 Tax=Brachionus plicatilis TaxID=10195 RepID=A0A3M7QRG1_BRAPC|nr:hypothetical protein BpHYR1_016291 [Brachionus plicatilis]
MFTARYTQLDEEIDDCARFSVVEFYEDPLEFIRKLRYVTLASTVPSELFLVMPVKFKQT